MAGVRAVWACGASALSHSCASLLRGWAMTLCLHGSRIQPEVGQRMTITCSLRANNSQTKSGGPSGSS